MSPAIQPTVIVVGSGLAGLSAVYAALQSGARVHLLDRSPKLGGNSIKASSGINGAGTPAQEAAGVKDTQTQFYNDTARSGGARFKTASTIPGFDREALVTRLSTESADAVRWLSDEIGVDLSVVAQLGGHGVARTHRGKGKPPGASIVLTLLDRLKASDNFTLLSSADVTSLLQHDGAVTGVAYTQDDTEHTLAGRVVVASGGFAGDASMLATYTPALAGLPSTNDPRPGSHALLTAVGAQLLDMDSVQIHPTGFVDPATPGARLKFLAGEMLRGEGGILLSPSGSRFVNELDTRAAVSKAIMDAFPSVDEDGTRQWDITLLLDPGAAAAAASHIGFYEWKGLLRKVKLATLSPEVVASVRAYAAAVDAGSADPFSRPAYGHWKLKPDAESLAQAEVYIGRITPVVHYTMGGAAIDTGGRVLRATGGGVVPGLWAAGEVTGGVHGDNRLGGNSLLECVVFGLAAGNGAARGS